MTLADVMKQERDAIMVEYLFPQGPFSKVTVPPYSAIPDISVLVETPWHLRSRHPLTIRPFANHGFAQICPTLGYKFLWTAPENDKYREDYFAFLKEYYGVTISALPREIHVDHLFNRARGIALGLRFIRMMLLPGSINMSHGAAYEKSRTKGIVGAAGRQRSIDPILLMKLYGIRSPRKGKELTPEMTNHARRIAAMLNISGQEAEQDIKDMMEVANYRGNA